MENRELERCFVVFLVIDDGLNTHMVTLDEFGHGFKFMINTLFSRKTETEFYEKVNSFKIGKY